MSSRRYRSARKGKKIARTLVPVQKIGENRKGKEKHREKGKEIGKRKGQSRSTFRQVGVSPLVSLGE